MTTTEEGTTPFFALSGEAADVARLELGMM